MGVLVTPLLLPQSNPTQGGGSSPPLTPALTPMHNREGGKGGGDQPKLCHLNASSLTPPSLLLSPHFIASPSRIQRSTFANSQLENSRCECTAGVCIIFCVRWDYAFTHCVANVSSSHTNKWVLGQLCLNICVGSENSTCCKIWLPVIYWDSEMSSCIFLYYHSHSLDPFAHVIPFLWD